MDKAERDTMAELETRPATAGPTRKRPGRPPGPTPQARATNGTAPPAVSVVVLLKQELRTIETRAARIRRALTALQA